VNNTPKGDFSKRSDGRVRDVQARNGTNIHNNLSGGRRVSGVRPDGRRVMAEHGGRGGYVQRAHMYRGREFGHRTYYRNGRVYDRFYASYSYRGAYLNVYAPTVYYSAGFYGWAYNPWVAPAPYAWGWAGSPWRGYYGAYFTPYPAYANASLWLTDYMIAQSLEASYAARAANQQMAQSQMNGMAAMTPEVKEMIASEVRYQIALATQEAQNNARNVDGEVAASSIKRIFDDTAAASHVFVVGSELDLIDADGQECAVSQGDVLRLVSRPPSGADAATVEVLSSKGGVECSRGRIVSVGFVDLQDMHNHMRENVDQGLAELQSRPAGLPAPPPSAMGAPVQASFAANAPPPDQDVATQINAELTEAASLERDVTGGADGPAGQPAQPLNAQQPAVLQLGLTVDQVVGMIGPQLQVFDKGAQQIYVFKDYKITFTDGKVTDIN